MFCQRCSRSQSLPPLPASLAKSAQYELIAQYQITLVACSDVTTQISQGQQTLTTAADAHPTPTGLGDMAVKQLHSAPGIHVQTVLHARTRAYAVV